MHIKQGFLLKKIADVYTAIPYDDNYGEFGAMVSLNETGAFLWQCMEEECTEESLVLALKEKYAIDASLAGEAVSAFLLTLREHNLLEE